MVHQMFAMHYIQLHLPQCHLYNVLCLLLLYQKKVKDSVRLFHDNDHSLFDKRALDQSDQKR